MLSAAPGREADEEGGEEVVVEPVVRRCARVRRETLQQALLEYGDWGVGLVAGSRGR